MDRHGKTTEGETVVRVCVRARKEMTHTIQDRMAHFGCEATQTAIGDWSSTTRSPPFVSERLSVPCGWVCALTNNSSLHTPTAPVLSSSASSSNHSDERSTLHLVRSTSCDRRRDVARRRSLHLLFKQYQNGGVPAATAATATKQARHINSIVTTGTPETIPPSHPSKKWNVVVAPPLYMQRHTAPSQQRRTRRKRAATTDPYSSTRGVASRRTDRPMGRANKRLRHHSNKRAFTHKASSTGSRKSPKSKVCRLTGRCVWPNRSFVRSFVWWRASQPATPVSKRQMHPAGSRQ